MATFQLLQLFCRKEQSEKYIQMQIGRAVAWLVER